MELADTLVDDFDVVDLLTLLTDRCVEVFEVGAAGLMLAAPSGGDLRVMASSSEAMRDLELYEIQASEGPCLDCYRSGEPVVNQDLEAAVERWPRFAPTALAAGFRSVSRPAHAAQGHHDRRPQPLPGGEGVDERGRHVAAQAFADVATIAILQHQAADDAQDDQRAAQPCAQQPHRASSRPRGCWPSGPSLGVDEAFAWLRNHARSHNLRLVDVAQAFIDGDVPLSSITPPK